MDEIGCPDAGDRRDEIALIEPAALPVSCHGSWSSISAFHRHLVLSRSVSVIGGGTAAQQDIRARRLLSLGQAEEFGNEVRRAPPTLDRAGLAQGGASEGAGGSQFGTPAVSTRAA